MITAYYSSDWSGNRAGPWCIAATIRKAWVTHRVLQLPSNVGLLLMGLAASLVLIGFELLLPNIAIFEDLHSFMETFDFSSQNHRTASI